MSYRTVDERFWTDPDTRKMDTQTKLLFLYLITNPHAHYSGLYYLPCEIAMFETGITAIPIQYSFDTLSNGYIAKYDPEFCVVWVVKMAKYQILSEKQTVGVLRHFETLPKTALRGEFAAQYPEIVSPELYPINTHSEPIRYPIDTTETETETETEKKQKLPSPKKPSPEYSDDFEQFWSAYPRKEGKTTAYKTWKARIKEGAAPQDIVTAARNYADRCNSDRRETKYMKLPATFLNPDWREYLQMKTDGVRRNEMGQPLLANGGID